MKVILNKEGALLSQFDNINENDILILDRLADLPPPNSRFTAPKNVNK